MASLEAAMHGPTFPGMNREKEQYSTAKKYFQKYYSKNRNKIKKRMQRWYRKHKRDPLLKRDKQRREKYPGRFERRPGGYRSNAERARDLRQEKKAWQAGFTVWYLPWGEEVQVLSVDTETATAVLRGSSGEGTISLLDMFDSMVFTSESDLARIFKLLDEAFEYAPGEDLEEDEEEEQLLDAWYFPGQQEKVSWLMEKMTPDVPADQRYNRATPRDDHDSDPLPGFAPDQKQQVYDSPGSARVIPRNHDFVNNKAAARMAEIRDKCDPRVQGQAGSLVPSLKRVNMKHLKWLFRVPASKGAPYTVHVKALAKGSVTALSKMDILVSCSCPYWQWQGPEHWAKLEGYLYGKPRGTATKPLTKDPDGKHRACKHVLAVLAKMAQWTLSRPVKKRGSRETASIRLAHRYLIAVMERGGIDADI
jgi:hypothetical protein